MKQVYKYIVFVALVWLGAAQVWGNSTTSSNSSGSVSNNKITINGNHATFYMSGSKIESSTLYGYSLGTLNAKKSSEYTLTWTVNTGCTITVTGISFKMRAYNTNAFTSSSGQVVFNGTTTVVGTAGASGWQTISATGTFSSGIKIKCDNVAKIYPFDYYIKDITFTYTITPNSPTASTETKTIYVTLDNSNVAADEKLQLNTSDCFTVAGNDSHFYSSLGYSKSVPTGSTGDNNQAYISNNYFNATKVGTYNVKAKINSVTNCHEVSGYSGNITIEVIRHTHTLALKNGEVFVNVNNHSSSKLDLSSLITANVSGGAMSYEVTSSNSAAATISGSTFSATDCGTYTIKATSAQTDKYEEATTSFTVTVKKITPSVTILPEASSIKYLTTLSNSVLTGGVAQWNGFTVAGTFTWTNGSAKPAATTSDCKVLCEVLFTPTDLSRANTTTCNVYVPIDAIEQVITWNDAAGVISGDMTFTATTSGHDASVYYTSSDESVAKISGNRLIMQQTGKVVITAHADATCHYLAAETVSKEFEMNRTIPQVSATATSLTYGQTLASSTLTGTATYNGAAVAGTFSWVDSSIMPEVGTAPQLAQFVPDDNSRYATVTVAVNVTVGKASPNLTWTLGGTLRSNTKYYEPVSTKNKETGLTITTDNANVWYDAESNKLVVGEMSAQKTTVKITVWKQAETEHFAAESKAPITLTIIKKSTVCVDDVQDGENSWHVGIGKDNFADAMYDYAYSAAWCDSEGEGYREDYIKADLLNIHIHVYYTQKKGIMLGSWEDGFKGLASNIPKLLKIIAGEESFSYEPKSVDIGFTGVPKSVSMKVSSQSITTVDAYGTKGHFGATAKTWIVYESSDDVNFTQVDGARWTGDKTVSFNLKPSTRYIRVRYEGNFAGFIENLTITRRHGFEVDGNIVNAIAIPDFGTEVHPLQLPQTIGFEYYSLGACGTEDTIAVSSDNDAFYADVEGIYRYVDFDQYRTDAVLRVRCTDVNQSSGVITLTATDGTVLRVVVKSQTPEITSSTGIFHTGTEQNYVENSPYRGMRVVDFSKCFSGTTALFDSIYVFGVTGNTELVRNKFDYYDAAKGYWLPKVNKADETTVCNAHTPLFVYYNAGNKYVYKRTIKNAAEAGLQGLKADGKRLALMGYAPYAWTGTDLTEAGFMRVIGAEGQAVDVTLIDTEIHTRAHTADGTTTGSALTTGLRRGDNGVMGSGSVLLFETTGREAGFEARVHSVGENRLQAAAGQVLNVSGAVQGESMSAGVQQQLSAAIGVRASSSDTRVRLVIDDKWNGAAQVRSILRLQGSTGAGSVNIGNERGELRIDGGVVVLDNGSADGLAVGYRRALVEKNGQAAVVYGVGEQQTDGKVTITDGTIVADGLQLPYQTTVTGGTYYGSEALTGTQVWSMETLTNSRKPQNEAGKEVSERYLLAEEIPAGYGMQSVLLDDAGKLRSLLATETERVREVNPWIAATPDHEETADDLEEKHNLLYMEITDRQREYEGKAAAYQVVTNADEYFITKREGMLMQIDAADEWRMFVAPFDIKRVYVLELAAESQWENKTREAALAEQQVVSKQFAEYLAKYITPVEVSDVTNLSLLALVNKFLSEKGGSIYALRQFNGSNQRQSDYYLYEVESATGEDVWAFDGDRFTASWKPVAATAGETVMKQGRTYAMNFPFCPGCYDFDGYDYWTDKFVLFEGVGGQQIGGRQEQLDLLEEAASNASTQAVLSGNAGFSNVTVEDKVFVFDSETNYYMPQTGSTVLRPTESALFANVTNRAGAPLRAISRTGKAVFEETESTEVTTDLAGVAVSDWLARGARGELVLRSADAVRLQVVTIAGQQVAVEEMGMNDYRELQLPQGVYVVRSADRSEKVVVL